MGSIGLEGKRVGLWWIRMVAVIGVAKLKGGQISAVEVRVKKEK